MLQQYLKKEKLHKFNIQNKTFGNEKMRIDQTKQTSED